jgi:hypothetical protein
MVDMVSHNLSSLITLNLDFPIKSMLLCTITPTHKKKEEHSNINAILFYNNLYQDFRQISSNTLLHKDKSKYISMCIIKITISRCFVLFLNILKRSHPVSTKAIVLNLVN